MTRRIKVKEKKITPVQNYLNKVSRDYECGQAFPRYLQTVTTCSDINKLPLRAVKAIFKKYDLVCTNERDDGRGVYFDFTLKGYAFKHFDFFESYKDDKREMDAAGIDVELTKLMYSVPSASAAEAGYA